MDNIAVDTATELGIAVTYVPDYCVDEVSDHVMALLHTWNRKVAIFDRSVKEAGWGSVPLTMRVMRLRGKTIGIVGFGRIGLAVAVKARAFGLNILAADPVVPAEAVESLGGRLVDLPTLLAESDFVSLHAPLTPDTRHMIGKAQLAAMKPEAFLINAARGPLIDEAALYDALSNRGIAGAGLDVMEDNVPPRDHPLIGLDNIIITPHVAFSLPRVDPGVGATRRSRSRQRAPRPDARQPGKPGGAAAPAAEASAAGRLTYRRLCEDS